MLGSEPPCPQWNQRVTLPEPLSNIITDVKKTFEAKLYYPCLLLNLTLPDICVATTLDRNQQVKQIHYVSFRNRCTTARELGMNGLDCYRIRCGMVHRGDANGHQYFGADHVIFTVPESRAQIHALTIQADNQDAAMFSLQLFCGEMELAVERWYAAHRNDPKVDEAIQKLLSWRPQGVYPFVDGFPVLASGL